LLKEHTLRTKQLIKLAAVLALCAIASAACSKGSNENANNTSGTAPSNSANKNAATTAAKGDLSTPTATFRSFYDAARANDIEALKRSLSAKTLEMAQKDSANEKKSFDEFLTELAKDAPATAPETRNEKIDGDNATLEFKDDKSDKWSPVKFVKENGQWKIALLEDMAG
jgi:hypothetical protein